MSLFHLISDSTVLPAIGDMAICRLFAAPPRALRMEPETPLVSTKNWQFHAGGWGC